MNGGVVEVLGDWTDDEKSSVCRSHAPESRQAGFDAVLWVHVCRDWKVVCDRDVLGVV
jgi:hypothetical protein